MEDFVNIMDGNKYIDLKRVPNIEYLPFCIRIILENILRNYDGFKVNDEHVETILRYNAKDVPDREIPFCPNRILAQDFTGVPLIVDLASLRSAVASKGKDPSLVNPLIPIDLVIDHSVIVESYGNYLSLSKNVELEYEQNKERYIFLKWAQKSFKNLLLIPPSTGICHQINLEYLSKVVWVSDGFVFPDTVIGTDSHTPMVNGIGVVGWGVGGIEAEAVALGQPLYFSVPEVIGLKLIGNLNEKVTATDLVLHITELLRRYGVVGKFVEVFGPGLDNLSVPDRATISNMSPEFGSTITYFPIDSKTLEYLKLTNRPSELINLIERYTKENLLWRESEEKIIYTDVIEVDLSEVEPCVAGPRRPQDKVKLQNLKSVFFDNLKTYRKEGAAVLTKVKVKIGDEETEIKDGDIVIAAITSCTNTSNPFVMLGAGLLAKKAVQRGLTVKKHVKTTLAPGSKVVTRYLEEAGLMPYLEALRFFVSGYGCTTCIGNSGSLNPEISRAIAENGLVVAAVLSGNRNFEARIHPLVRMNFLASPILVIAFAIAGTIHIDIFNDPIGYDPLNKPVYLTEILPTNQEIYDLIKKVVKSEFFKEVYQGIIEGDENWKTLLSYSSELYPFDDKSTYIKKAPFFDDEFLNFNPSDIIGAKVLLLLGDSVTTDHISPAGSIRVDSPAGKYLISCGVEPKDFNSYGSRRGNHEVMIRGTFANVRLKNRLVDVEGGYTLKDGQIKTVYEAAMEYKRENIPLIIIAGKEYGSGSSRDWAAKGTRLLGIRAVIAESFERIHRSNLVGMGVLPLQFIKHQDYIDLNTPEISNYSFNILGLDNIYPKKILKVQVINKEQHILKEFEVILRLDSKVEVEYYLNGGILQYVMKKNFLRQ
ncbi:MAG: aconitate hydratase AcnA [Candidatus Calescibacterium sp.]|nr:aconitate hydratase AcnA [Candidatus Calescibacterium sp.]MCX7972147.1 aconitate hydratase AcnA [bacterium]MDW8194836.1 aconitate hydratase AcnA [Candidatus Calescibacterium sp.]